MKTVKLLMIALFVATAGAAWVSNARANDYDYSQEEVVIGEGDVAPDAAVPAPTMESYGVMPTWTNGCCDRQPSKADHLWDNYCYEKHACGWGCGGCCGKAFCGTGPFAKDCCSKSKCGPAFKLPKLNVLDNCCQKVKCCQKAVCQKAKSCRQSACQKAPCQKTPCQKAPCCKKAPCCQKAPCQKAPCCQKSTCCQKSKSCVKKARCRRPILSKLRLFRGCHSSKCGKGGKGQGSVVVEGANYPVDELPAPTIEGNVIEDGVIEMPNDVPVPPMSDPAA